MEINEKFVAKVKQCAAYVTPKIFETFLINHFSKCPHGFRGFF
jgi:hypothetical protein